MANEEILASIRRGLSPNDWRKFVPIVEKTGNLNVVEEAILWQAFYKANPADFYNLVLPQRNQSLYAITVGSQYKKEDIYKAASRIAMASNAFISEDPKLQNVARAWDITARATALARAEEEKYLAIAGHSPQDAEAKRLHATTSSYEEAEKTTFYNILRTRPAGFQVMGTLFKDPNTARRNRRIKKYLFRSSNDKVFARLNKKLAKLDTEGLNAIKQEIQQESAAITKTIHETSLPTFEAKGFVSGRVAKLANAAIDSGIEAARNKGVLQTPGIAKQIHESETMFPDDLRFIRATDKLFGLDLDSRNLKISTAYNPGKPLDINNMLPEQLTKANIIATAKERTINVVDKNLRSSTEGIADKSKRGARIVVATIVVITALVSVGLVIAFPPTLPLVIVANAVLLSAAGSFLYFSRDPISKATQESKGILSKISATLSDAIPKLNPTPVSFDMPATTKKFLQELDSEISTQLESHFKKRANEIEDILVIAISHDDQDAASSIRKDLDKLEQDWQKIITAANNATNTDNRYQFREVIKSYLRHEYENVERPKFIALAQQNKQQAQTIQKRNNLTFSQEKSRIDNLAKLVEKINNIDANETRKPNL